MDTKIDNLPTSLHKLILSYLPFTDAVAFSQTSTVSHRELCLRPLAQYEVSHSEFWIAATPQQVGIDDDDDGGNEDGAAQTSVTRPRPILTGLKIPCFSRRAQSMRLTFEVDCCRDPSSRTRLYIMSRKRQSKAPRQASESGPEKATARATARATDELSRESVDGPLCNDRSRPDPDDAAAITTTAKNANDNKDNDNRDRSHSNFSERSRIVAMREFTATTPPYSCIHIDLTPPSPGEIYDVAYSMDSNAYTLAVDNMILHTFAYKTDTVIFDAQKFLLGKRLLVAADAPINEDEDEDEYAHEDEYGNQLSTPVRRARIISKYGELFHLYAMFFDALDDRDGTAGPGIPHHQLKRIHDVMHPWSLSSKDPRLFASFSAACMFLSDWIFGWVAPLTTSVATDAGKATIKEELAAMKRSRRRIQAQHRRARSLVPVPVSSPDVSLIGIAESVPARLRIAQFLAVKDVASLSVTCKAIHSKMMPMHIHTPSLGWVGFNDEYEQIPIVFPEHRTHSLSALCECVDTFPHCMHHKITSIHVYSRSNDAAQSHVRTITNVQRSSLHLPFVPQDGMEYGVRIEDTSNSEVVEETDMSILVPRQRATVQDVVVLDDGHHSFHKYWTILGKLKLLDEDSMYADLFYLKMLQLVIGTVRQSNSEVASGSRSSASQHRWNGVRQWFREHLGSSPSQTGSNASAAMLHSGPPNTKVNSNANRDMGTQALLACLEDMLQSIIENCHEMYPLIDVSDSNRNNHNNRNENGDGENEDQNDMVVSTFNAM